MLETQRTNYSACRRSMEWSSAWQGKEARRNEDRYAVSAVQNLVCFVLLCLALLCFAVVFIFAGVCAHEWKSETNLWESALSFHYMSPRDQTQVVRTGNKLLYLMLYLRGPSCCCFKDMRHLGGNRTIRRE